MSAALLTLAAALLVAPAPRRRLRRSRRWRWHLPRWWWVPPLAGTAYLVGDIGAVAATAMASGTIVSLVNRIRLSRNRTRQQQYLLDALDTMIGELRVGAHPVTAAFRASQDSSGHAAAALLRASAHGQLSGDPAAGLTVADSPIGPDLDHVACSWRIAEQHGVTLAETLGAARSDVACRIRFHTRVQAAMAGARASAAVLAGLPLLGIGLGHLMGAAPLAVLCGTRIGGALLSLGTALLCVGVLWTAAITNRAGTR